MLVVDEIILSESERAQRELPMRRGKYYIVYDAMCNLSRGMGPLDHPRPRAKGKSHLRDAPAWTRSREDMQLFRCVREAAAEIKRIGA